MNDRPDDPSSGESWNVPGNHRNSAEPPCGCFPASTEHCTIDCTVGCTEDCTIDTIRLVGVRGGSGASTVAAVMALHASSMVGAELVTDDIKLTSALVGLSQPDGTPANAAPGLVLANQASDTAGLTVLDSDALKVHRMAARLPRERRIGVLRGPCYLALRTLTEAPHGLDGLILVAEPGRALNGRDVADVTGLDVVTSVPATPKVARTIDAGLLARRYRNLAEFGPLRRWLTLQLDPFPTRRSTPRFTAPNHPSMSVTDLPLPPDGERGWIKPVVGGLCIKLNGSTEVAVAFVEVGGDQR